MLTKSNIYILSLFSKLKMMVMLILMVLLIATTVFSINITISENVTFYDGTYNYTTNATHSLDTSLRVETSEVYFDNVPYCQYDHKNKIESIRQCFARFILDIFKQGEDWIKLNFTIIDS